MDSAKSSNSPRKQKQLGPAPIASFEDTSSDELKFKMDLNKADNQLTDIIEQDSPNKIANVADTSASPSNCSKIIQTVSIGIVTKSGLRVSSTPRIDISRASSSSQHEDSRDSSPENVFDQVGTGTLQETTAASDLGFTEDGTNELRSSTEELFFTEGDKVKSKIEPDKDVQQNRPSPVLFKFDEQQQACLKQNQRKDSASSEVAALLCISGRSSRISSVGSQGSAVSRLSAISGISRSPSPHKMLLETSFCGPKPVNSDLIHDVIGGPVSITSEELEQVILARKHDLTKVFLAEGIHVDTSTPKKMRSETKCVTNGDAKDDKIKAKKIQNTLSAVPLRNPATKKGTGVLKKVDRTVVGVTPEGTQYIRIKLKPDYLYDDKGVAPNEHIIEENENGKKPPASLSLNREITKKAAPHFSQLVQAENSSTKQSDQHLTPNVSPKPSRHSILRATGSRSPSPANLSVSRKSSFCSLFKGKETVASPDSPTAGSQRKKSAISILLDSPRDRSRSKSRDSDRSGGGQSANSTPSKQRSVLAIFKPKRSSSKSKSSSPVDPHLMATDTITQAESHQSRKQIARKDDQALDKPRLKYYETPSDGNSIYIPLHTPPDEKDNGSFTSHVAPIQSELQPHQQQLTITQISTTAKITTTSPTHKEETETMRSITKTIVSTSTTPTAKPQAKKPYRIELPDGSIRIPLRSPSEEHTEGEADADTSNWSIAVQRNSSHESQDTIISSQAPSLASTDAICKTKVVPKLNSFEISSNVSVAQVPKAIPQQSSQDEQSVDAPAIRTMSKERKRILFSTKIGSGSEEQIFATQLSLSKTESLSSQLSEQVSNLESPPIEKDESNRVEKAPPVKLRNKDENHIQAQEINRDIKTGGKQEIINVNRHSMYIENIDEIMDNQKRIDMERKNSLIGDAKMVVTEEIEIEVKQEVGEKKEPPIKPERLSKPCLSSRSKDSTEERTTISSESDHESDADLRHQRIPRQIGAVEEESTGLVAQDSYDDDLPYIPTTLPEERALGIAIIPIKDRALMDVRTCPVERPRSTTPLNPSFLEDYCGTVALTDDIDNLPVRGEKLRISLPRKECRDSNSIQRSKSPRRISNSSGKSWFDFAEQGIGASSPCTAGPNERKDSIPDESMPPQLPPKKSQNTAEWIDFENIPEKRKPAKRITTLPLQKETDLVHHVQYNYVNPDECQCECHGVERERGNTDSERKESLIEDQSPDDTVPLLESDPDDAGNRKSQVETSYDIIDFGESNSRNIRINESFKQQSFGDDSQENSKKKNSFDSGGSQSPVYSRTSKTTTVQLPQRLQR